MARLLLLFCGSVGLLSACTSAAALQERCSTPKEVNNADVTVGNNNLLNASLRYTCKDGYKRKAGTSSLIVCVMDKVTKTLRWTEPNLHCIRDPALPPVTSSPKQTTSAPRTETTSLVNKVSARVMLSSVGFPMLLTVVAVVLCCVWRRRVHMRQQYTIPVIAIPMTTEESEERDGTPPEDNGSNGPEQRSERTEMMSSSCVTSTG
ncbi:interleukin-15 receptor subunit alpha isoform X2 [Malaclemys terrapin pileata]|uniref:interleukin-15 receptor subunit alpha isoform X2 n=1 Tax=Malaclemys terrapin pileata TaxID=2991368 RepID=UPI0023A88258|nr:interleukin-15 receptor subunit alpha isoform X2 [Malaclemys terrapin pileata]